MCPRVGAHQREEDGRKTIFFFLFSYLQKPALSAGWCLSGGGSVYQPNWAGGADAARCNVYATIAIVEKKHPRNGRVVDIRTKVMSERIPPYDARISYAWIIIVPIEIAAN